jgi:hypothetical protein
MVAPVLRRSRRRESGRLAAAAVAYAAMGWPVALGAYPRGNARSAGRACSCDRVGCPAPAAHPMSPAWQIQATSDPGKARQRWARYPEANVILPTGRVFDVLDVPAPAGLAALAMMGDAGVETGPVAVGSGRILFFVATRGAPDNEDEWWSCHLDCAPEDVREVVSLRWHCRNSYVLAPPSRDGAGPAGRWVRGPDEQGGRSLPDAVRLLEVLADACDEETR